MVRVLIVLVVLSVCSSPIGAEEQPPKTTSEGQAFLRKKLAELDGFKNNPKFHEVGFGRGGPYLAWLDSIQAARAAKKFTLAEQFAVSDLLTLGMEYKSTKGAENKVTSFARKEILRAIEQKRWLYLVWEAAYGQ